MSWKRFNDILHSLGHTPNAFSSGGTPAYFDTFLPIRDLITAWNLKMAESFSSSFLSCPDELTVRMNSPEHYVGCFMAKPHPFGSMLHAIACGLARITYHLEYVEGKNWPVQFTPLYEEAGKKSWFDDENDTTMVGKLLYCCDRFQVLLHARYL